MNPVAAASLAFTLALFPHRAGGQDPRLGARLDPTTRAAVTAIVDTARAAGLPTEPLIDRALEGASKRADATQIISAVRALADLLRAAQAALGASSSEAEMTAGAEALSAGVSTDILSRLRVARRAQPVTVALATLSDLVALGVPPDTASAALLLLVRSGAGDAELVAFRRDVERDIRAGVPPAAAASIRTRGDKQKRP